MLITKFIRSLHTPQTQCGPAASITPLPDESDRGPRWAITLPTGTRLIVDDAPDGVDVWVERPNTSTTVSVGDTPADGFASYTFTFPCGLCGDPITEGDLTPTSRHACCGCGWRDRSQDGRVTICPDCNPLEHRQREYHNVEMKRAVTNLDIMAARDHMIEVERIEQRFIHSQP